MTHRTRLLLEAERYEEKMLAVEDSLYQPCVECDGDPVYKFVVYPGCYYEEHVLAGHCLNGRFYELGTPAPLCPEHQLEQGQIN